MKKSKIIKNQREQIIKMIDNICDLEAEIDDLKYQLECKEEEMLNKYKYAILVDKGYRVKVWNDERFEPSVKSISFESNENGCLPNLTIWK